MPSNPIHAQRGRQKPPSSPGPAVPAAGMFPLHRLANIFCSTGACHEVEFWKMAVAKDGWLQLGPDPDAAEPVDLIAFSSMCVSVALSADVPLQQGACARLMTHAHGAGLKHCPVRCCWHRSHPQDSSLQCTGLRFDYEEMP